MDAIESLDDLLALYGAIPQGALDKELTALTQPYKAMIEASPFVVMATHAADGIDCSPRGDDGQVVYVEDMKTLLLPDRRGNNRLDSLQNLLKNPNIGLFFLVPGTNETLRVRGTASVFRDEALGLQYLKQGKPPITFVRVHITNVQFQCGRAVMRSGLWGEPQAQKVPTAGQMMVAAKEGFDGEGYDAALADRQKKTLY